MARPLLSHRPELRFAAPRRAALTAALVVASVATIGASTRPVPVSDAIVGSDFLHPAREGDAVHAPTVVATDAGLVAAWYEGTKERAKDVVIRVARHDGSGWGESVVVADGRREDGSEEATWNPVLFEPDGGPLLLFYKVGGNPRSWRGAARISSDGGATWSAEVALPQGRIGPTRAKPVQLADGSLLIGSSTESHLGWNVYLERLSPYGAPDRGVYSLWEEPPGEPVRDGRWTAELLAAPGAWTQTPSLASEERLDAIQPTLLVHSDRRVRLLARTRSGFVAESLSGDGGDTWGRLRRTPLANPDAGIDALRLQDGRFLLAYNPGRDGRGRIGVAVSEDAESWRYVVELENDDGAEYSYPAIVQAPDGLVHLVYTWRRERIRHVVLDPARIR